jgi:large subunit ribosomal protein L29
MKMEELKGKTRDELISLLRDGKKELLNLRFRKAGGELENTSEIDKARKNVARIKTQLSTLKNAA